MDVPTFVATSEAVLAAVEPRMRFWMAVIDVPDATVQAAAMAMDSKTLLKLSIFGSKRFGSI